MEDVALVTQNDVPSWSGLLRSTGGAIKGPKSGWFLINYECVNGEWTEKETPFDLRVPISDNESIVLHQFRLDKAVKSLGVSTSPLGGHADQLLRIHKKTEEWTTKMGNGHLPVSHVHLSYTYQLWPALRYGLGALTNDWESSSDCLTPTEFKLLPLLGINRHINKPWRRIHQTFGGVGLFDLAVEQHICRVLLFCQHYGTPSTIGKKLLTSLHWLQIQIGCAGCPLLEDYNTWGHLSTLSWVKCFWESMHQSPCDLHIVFDGVDIQRDGDITLMAFAQHYGLTSSQLISFNRCRCYGRLMLLSDITQADGSAIEDQYCRAYFAPRVSSITFPPECPSQSDWLVWTEFWSTRLSLADISHTLGDWRRPPHFHWTWFYDALSESVYLSLDSGFGLWKRRPGRTRLETGYVDTGHVVIQHTGLPASVHSMAVGGITRVILPRTGPLIPIHQPPSSQTFWEVLKSWGGTWMWSSIQFDSRGSDTSWLTQSLDEGTLIGVVDGSYDRVRAPHICGTGWILCDSVSQRKLAGSFTEVSSSASSYRGEILGLYAMHILLRSIESTYTTTNSLVTVHCDNEVAVKRAGDDPRRIKPRWACGDILQALHNIRPLLRSKFRFRYVKSHMDDHVPWEQMSLEEQLNCQCD